MLDPDSTLQSGNTGATGTDSEDNNQSHVMPQQQTSQFQMLGQTQLQQG
jgi:hypothetical protein